MRGSREFRPETFVSIFLIIYNIWYNQGMSTQRVLDRLPQFDERSRGFGIMALVTETVYQTKFWDCDIYNDQGQEGACVGFGWSHELAATPEVVPTNATIALSIYHRAQQLDQWAGENYSGTSVLAGAKAVSELRNNIGEPYLKEYRWAFGLSDLLLALGYHGPAVLGVNWFNNMFAPDANGYLHVSGGVAGGHCILALGVYIVPKAGVTAPSALSDLDLDNSYVLVHNSWGSDWGQHGRAKISLSDIQILLDSTNDGEACIPVVRTSDQVIAPVDPNVPSPTPDPAPVKPKTDGSYFTTKRSNIFHGRHPGLRPTRRFQSKEEATAAGFRACNVCRP